MSTDTAEVIDRSTAGRPIDKRTPRLLRAVRSDEQRTSAIRECWRALWVSRLLVFLSAAGTIGTFGFGPVRRVFDPPGLTRGFGWLGDLLAAPAARWDSVWYLVIAHYGYRPDLGPYTAARTAFFPLYPLALRGVSELGTQPVIAGVVISTVMLALALYGIHRLSTLELGAVAGPDVGRFAVLFVAFAPMAFYLSAVYSESMYLAFSVAAFWYARHGRWPQSAAFGALAAATRSTGIVLLVPLLIFYFYGPRTDRPVDRLTSARWRPRYRTRRDLAWLALLPVAVGVYLGHLWLAGESPLEPFTAQQVWSRHFAGPFMGVWDGAEAAWDGLRQLLFFQSSHVYFHAGVGDPTISAAHNLTLFVFLLFAALATIGVLRRLPFAYGAYVIAALALPLSDPVSSQPLMSLPRFLLVLFPLFMWQAGWSAGKPVRQRALLVLSGVLMVVFLAQFATWHWVA